MELLSIDSYDQCSHCKKWKMVYIVEMNDVDEKFCWKCGNQFIEKVKEIDNGLVLSTAIRKFDNAFTSPLSHLLLEWIPLHEKSDFKS